MANGKRSIPRGQRFDNPRAVLVFEREKTVYCKSMAEAMLLYEIPSTSMLERLIERGGVWRDGYTTFDWALDEPPNRRTTTTGGKR
jgi:hypothetical protein